MNYLQDKLKIIKGVKALELRGIGKGFLQKIRFQVRLEANKRDEEKEHFRHGRQPEKIPELKYGIS